jgi:parvulin-like peptidyl-prolyl isomerase
MKGDRLYYWGISLIVIVFLLAGCASSPKKGSLFAQAAPEQGAGDVVARVGDRIITVYDLQERFNAMFPDQDGSVAGLKKKALEGIVQMRLLSLEARAEKIDGEESVASTLRNMVDNTLAREYYSRKIHPNVTAADETIEDYYQSHLDEFTRPLKVKARHILVGVEPDASPEAWAEAEEKARGLKKEIDNGADFKALAKAHSDDRRTKTKGGSLRGITYTYLTREKLPAGFPDSVFSMEQGEISDPVKGAKGYHIIKVESKLPEQIRTLDEAKQDIKRKLEKQKYDDLLAQTIERLKKKHKVVLDTDLLASVKIEKRARKGG